MDILLERDGMFHPVEIKLTANPNRRMVSGIEAFRAAHPHLNCRPGALLCAVERALWVSEHVLAIPWNLI